MGLFKKMLGYASISMMLSLMGMEVALAATGSAPAGSIGTVASTVSTSLPALVSLLTALAFVVGVILVIFSLYGFKTYKENPTQNQIGKYVVMFFVGIALVYIAQSIYTGGATIFGSGAVSNGTSGFSSLPAQ